MDSFSLPNYSLVNENKRLSNHGGLIIYVHDNFSFKVLNKDMLITHTSKLFESLIVEIWRNNCKYQKYIIGSIYRLPSYVNIDIEIFTEEYTELLNNLRSRSKFVYLCGDYNIDLLKISTNNVLNKFYENITSCGFIPKITLPTRICDTTSTLIGNVYTNAIDKSHISGILIHPISDHQMYFCVLDETYQRLNNKPKYIEFEKLNGTSMIEFKHEIENADLNRKLNHELSADPNLNYEILAKVLQSAKTKHIPKVTKKINKRKHKREKWMTDELLKLVVRKNELYVEWKTTAVDDPLFKQRKRNFRTYDNIFKYYIRNAKKNYFHNTFAMFKHDMKKTWAVISETLNKNKKRKDEPLTFKCNGRDLSDDIEIANEFNRIFCNYWREFSI